METEEGSQGSEEVNDPDEEKRKKASAKAYKSLPKTEKTIIVRDHDRIPYSGRLALIGLVLSSMVYDKAVKDDKSIDLEDFPIVESWKVSGNGLVDAIIKWPRSKTVKKLVFDYGEVIHSMSITSGEAGVGYKTKLMEIKTQGDKLDHGVAAALARVKIAEERLAAFQWSTQALREIKNSDTDYSTIYSQLYQGISRAYQDLFMWGNLLGDDLQEYAKNLALRKFVSDQEGVSRYLDFDDRWHGSHYVEDEDRLRKEIKQLNDNDEKEVEEKKSFISNFKSHMDRS